MEKQSNLLDVQLMKIVELLNQDKVSHELYTLVSDGISTFERLMELQEFVIQKGWSADDLIKVTNVISALQK